MQLCPGRQQTTINTEKYVKNKQQRCCGSIVTGKFRYKRRNILVCSLKVEIIVRSKCCGALFGDLCDQICTSWPPEPTSNKCSSQKTSSWGSFPDNDPSCGKWQWFIIKHYIYKYIPCGDYFKITFLPTLQKYFSVFLLCQFFERSLETFTLLWARVYLDISWMKRSRFHCIWFRICFEILVIMQTFIVCFLNYKTWTGKKQSSFWLLIWGKNRESISKDPCWTIIDVGLYGMKWVCMYISLFLYVHIHAPCMCINNIV